MTRTTRGFRVNPKIRTQLDTRKRRIDRRLDKHDLRGMERPMFTATNLHYEIADFLLEADLIDEAPSLDTLFDDRFVTERASDG